MEQVIEKQFEAKSILTAKALIEKRELLKQRKNEQVRIEVKDIGEFIFKIPDFFDVEDAKASSNSDAFLVYACSIEPCLRSKEIQDSFGVNSPLDVVNEIFMTGEVSSIATILLNRSGYSSDTIKVIDKVKN